MAVAVSKENNILKVDNGTKIEYLNAIWCTMEFNNSTVVITDEGRTGSGFSISIAFSDFEDELGNPYATESAIATYLSDKIG